ncbi:hypothetical protein [Nesterenkonia sandarakina]|uniref:Uncharacterized protein n=1 Tax=Nesterenkonia sandarakina TaxID=272918 RepID=A0A2T0YDR1_9MICC|nr:hypothetical protein [Nesterenkonia sandarakina]PRZ12946.1 hypothetical protein BCL67_11748 [Nesterenkonia sandarakina]
MVNDSYLCRESLIAGALTGNLSDDERQELKQARAADPTIDEEVDELRTTVERLDAADITWREGSVPDGLEERILAKIAEEDRSWSRS